EGAFEDTRRVSGRLEGVRQPVLYHQPNRRVSAHLPDESLVGDRRQAGEGVFAKSRQAQVLDAHQLLRSNRGARWARESFGSRSIAGIRANEGRSGRVREPGLSRSDESYAGGR